MNPLDALAGFPILKYGGVALGGALIGLGMVALDVEEKREWNRYGERMWAGGRAEASAEQAAEIFRLQEAAKTARAREDAARRIASDEIERITRNAEARVQEALARARAASGGDVLSRPVPAGLRLRPGPAPAGLRGPGDAGADSGSDA